MQISREFFYGALYSFKMGNRMLKIIYSLCSLNPAVKPGAMRMSFFALLLLAVHCSSELGSPRQTAINLDRRRGCVIIQEVNWAGSMKNNGSYDADDDFLEMVNRDCNKPVDLTDWRLIMRGDVNRIYYVPPGPNNVVGPGQFAVIIAKTDGAFQQGSDSAYKPISLPGFFIPERNWTIETQTAEDFLIENEIGNSHGWPLAGGFDGVVTRSMERTDDNFEEEGVYVSSWFSYTPCNETSPSQSVTRLLGTSCTNFSIGSSGKFVNSQFNLRTFASPGEQNTPDYR